MYITYHIKAWSQSFNKHTIITNLKPEFKQSYSIIKQPESKAFNNGIIIYVYYLSYTSLKPKL